MGIRIHKCLCYGLNDVKSKKYEIIDERFNQKFLEEKDNYYDDFNKEDFVNFLDKEIEDIKNSDSYNLNSYNPYLISLKLDRNSISKKEIEFDFYNFYIQDFEYGLNNFIGFIPIGYKDWKRYDNTIDYYEENNQELKPKLKEIIGGIYPYVGTYYNIKTKEKLDDDAMIIIRYINGILNKKGKAKEKYINENYYLIDETLRKFKLNSIEDFRTNVRPTIPSSIRALCKYFNIFKDLDTIYSLKPYLYTYWS